jgi:hypothetical protein
MYFETIDYNDNDTGSPDYAYTVCVQSSLDFGGEKIYDLNCRYGYMLNF